MSINRSVILLNMGGPENEEQIRPFLRNLFADKEIIQLPLQPLLSRLIIFFRTPKVIENYRLIGGGSPLIKITGAQAAALEKELHAQGVNASVHVAMRYTPPRAEGAVKQVLAKGAETILALPLYPHYSRATTGSSLNDLMKAVEAQPGKPEIKVVNSWCDHASYLDVLAKKVQEGLDSFSPEYREDVQVIF